MIMISVNDYDNGNFYDAFDNHDSMCIVAAAGHTNSVVWHKLLVSLTHSSRVSMGFPSSLIGKPPAIALGIMIRMALI